MCSSIGTKTPGIPTFPCLSCSSWENTSQAEEGSHLEKGVRSPIAEPHSSLLFFLQVSQQASLLKLRGGKKHKLGKILSPGILGEHKPGQRRGSHLEKGVSFLQLPRHILLSFFLQVSQQASLLILVGREDGRRSSK